MCKPSAAAYDLVFKRLGVRPEEALFFDDSVRNIRGAHDLGIMTVLVSALVPGLWKGGCVTRPHSKKLYSNRLHYKMDCTRLGVRPEEAIFFDDSVRNIRGALELGIMTVLFSHQGFAWAPLR